MLMRDVHNTEEADLSAPVSLVEDDLFADARDARRATLVEVHVVEPELDNDGERNGIRFAGDHGVLLCLGQTENQPAALPAVGINVG